MIKYVTIARMGSSSNSYFPTPSVPVRDQFKVVGILGIQCLLVICMISWIESEKWNVMLFQVNPTPAGPSTSMRSLNPALPADPRLLHVGWPLCPSHFLPSLIALQTLLIQFCLAEYGWRRFRHRDTISGKFNQLDPWGSTHKKTGSGSSTWSSGGSLSPSSTHLPRG